MKIIVFNQKGGVGKTTTAINLGYGLARWGSELITLVDLDPQTHLTAALGLRAETFNWNVSHWLAENSTQEAKGPMHLAEQLDLVPGDCHPPSIRKLSVRMDTLEGHWVIDAPPSWSDEVAALLAACDYVLTPLEPEFLSMQGISRLMQRMESCGISWSRLRLLLCRYDQRLAVHREVRDRLADRFGEHLLPDVIRKNVRLAEAPGYGQSIFDYAPESAGAKDYANLVYYFMADHASTGNERHTVFQSVLN